MSNMNDREYVRWHRGAGDRLLKEFIGQKNDYDGDEGFHQP